MGGVGTQVVVECDSASDASPGLRIGFPSMTVDSFVFQRPPEPPNEDVVQVSGFAVRRDLGLGPL
jgi:hypothetical protein